MRIAIVIWQLDTYGGSIRQALELANHLTQLKQDVEVITYSLNKARCFPELVEKLSIFTSKDVKATQVFYNPSSSFFTRVKGFLNNLYIRHLQIQSLTATLKERHKIRPFQIINYHDNGVISIAKKFPDLKNVWMLNDPPSFIDTREKKASAYSDSLLFTILALVQAIYTRVELRSISDIVVLDKRNCEIVQRYFLRSAKIIRSGLVIPPSLRKFKPKPQRMTLTVLVTNIFFRHRRYEDLIQALDIVINQMKVKNLRLRIIGDPESDRGYYEAIKALATETMVLNYITFMGRVDERTLFQEYEKAEIFVFPNHNQTWGLSVFEAMAHGCACIISKGSGAHEVLTDGKNAVLVESKHPEQIAEKLIYLVRNQTKRQQIAKAGHAFVTQNISWNKYSKEMLKLFS